MNCNIICIITNINTDIKENYAYVLDFLIFTFTSIIK